MNKILWGIAFAVIVLGIIAGGVYIFIPHTFENSSEHTALSDAFTTGDVSGALAAAQALVLKYPDSSQAYVGLALAYAQSVSAGTETDGAAGEAAAQKAVTLDPQNPDGYRALGYIYEVEGKYPESIGAYTKGLSVVPNHPLLLSYKAHAEWLSGDVVSAQTDFEHALVLDPNLTHAKLNVSLVYLSLGTPDALDKAASLLHHVIASNAAPADILTAESTLGSVLLVQGDFVNAEKSFADVLEQNPTSVHDELGVAWAEYYQLASVSGLTESDPRVAVLMTHITHVQKNSPNSSSSYHVLGLLYYLVGDKTKGDAALNQGKVIAFSDTSLTEDGVAAMVSTMNAALKAEATKK